MVNLRSGNPILAIRPIAPTWLCPGDRGRSWLDRQALDRRLFWHGDVGVWPGAGGRHDDVAEDDGYFWHEHWRFRVQGSLWA